MGVGGALLEGGDRGMGAPPDDGNPNSPGVRRGFPIVLSTVRHP